MAESDWLACTDPHKMLDFLRGMVSDRKLRLFACASARRVWEYMTDDRCRAAVELAERYADERATKAEMTESHTLMTWAHNEAENAWYASIPERPEPTQGQLTRDPTQVQLAIAKNVTTIARSLLDPQSEEAARVVSVTVCFVIRWVHGLNDVEYELAAGKECEEQVHFFRHIIGNPFKPYPAPPAWPSTVVQLASAMYNGQDCSFALHDALLEAGHAELAKHFKDEAWHPKGCYVLDLVLKRK